MKSLYSFIFRVESASNVKLSESLSANQTKNLFKKFILRTAGVVALFLFLGGSVWGQVSSYTFAESLGSYSPITGGTNIPSTAAAWLDDNTNTAALPIGFTFTFNNVNYTSFGYNANGWISLGTGLPTSSTTPISATSTTYPVISAFGLDIIGRIMLTGNRTSGSNIITITAGDITQIAVGDVIAASSGIPANTTITAISGSTITMSANATSNSTGFNVRIFKPTTGIRYETIGVAPNRSLVVQWSGFNRYATAGAFGEVINFQIVLSETSNNIQFIYNILGPSSTTALTPQVGIRGLLNTEYNNRTKTGSTAWLNNTSAGTANTSTVNYVNTSQPASGLIFQWTPPPPPACATPSALVSSNVTNTSATISWTAASPAPSNGYEYFYSTSSTAPTAGTTPSGSTAAGVVTANITGLTANTTYYYWVRSNCGGSGTSTWTGSSTFFTGYCQPSIPASSSTYFSNFITTGGATNIANNTGAIAANGYGNYFATLSASQFAAGSLGFSATIVGGTAGIAVFVDWNNDLDFTDIGETVYSSNAYQPTGTTTSSFTIPAGTPIGDYRMRIVTDWNVTNPASCSFALTGRGEMEDYKLSVIAPPSCFAPTALIGTPITLTTATISWTGPSPTPASGYEYYVSTSAITPTAGTAPTGSTSAGITTANLSSLTLGTTYYFWVRSVCSVADVSTWAGAGSFYVGYCVPVTTYGCTDGDVIARVVLNTLDNNSGTGCPSGLAGYSDYTSNPLLTTTLLPSSTYSCTVYAGQYSEGYAAWIDYNDDGVFDNITERIGYSNGQVAGSGVVGVLGSSASFPITLACTPPAGNHRLRVRAMYSTNGINVSPCTANSYGEVEDYLITIAPAPACPSPGLMSTLTPTSSSVALTWALGCSSSTNYDFEYGAVGFSLGSGTQLSNQTATISGSNASYTLVGLQAGMTYDIYFRANCGGGSTSSWSLVSSFTTLNSVSAASTAPTLCQGTALTSITHTTYGATGIGAATGLPSGVTASWSSSTITISGTPSVSGVFSYSIPLTGGIGSVNATGIITVLAAPNAPTATSPQVFCETANATIASLQVSGAGSTFTWYTAATGGAALSSSTELSLGTTNYFVEATGANGCVSLTRTSVSVTENPLLSASVSITGTTACPGGVLMFTATPVNGGTNPTFQWYNNGVVIPNETASTYSASGLLAGDVINVKMIPSGSCVTVCP